MDLGRHANMQQELVVLRGLPAGQHLDVVSTAFGTTGTCGIRDDNNS